MKGKPGLEHEYSVQIADEHLDSFGHVNNAAYLAIFEQARWDWITRNGFGLREIKERGIGPTILEVRLRFQREIRGRERVIIRSRTTEYRGKLARVEQVMTREDGVAACTAEYIISLFDLKTRKLIKPTPEWLKAVGYIDVDSKPSPQLK